MAVAMLKDFVQQVSADVNVFCPDVPCGTGNMQVGIHLCFWIASFLDPLFKHLSTSHSADSSTIGNHALSLMVAFMEEDKAAAETALVAAALPQASLGVAY